MPSSVIERMDYDPRWRVLRIAFRGSGEVYRYYGVPPAVWREFVAAPSKGTYLNETFKALEFRYERADPREMWARTAADGVEVWPENAKESGTS